MTDDSFGLRKKTDHELYIWIAGWKPETDKSIAGKQELRRRNESQSNMRAWIAIGIALFSLLISGVALLKSLGVI